MDYPSNSNKDRQASLPPPQSAEPIVTNPTKVRVKRPSLFRMIFEQDLKDIKDCLITEYIEPRLKDIAYGIFESALSTVDDSIQMMIYKNSRPGGFRGTMNKPAPTPYNRISTQARSYPPTTVTSSYNYNEIIYSSYGEADAVLTAMKEWIHDYGTVAVARYYDFSNYTGSQRSYTDNDYGWTDLSHVTQPKKIPEGFILELGRAKQLPK